MSIQQIVHESEAVVAEREIDLAIIIAILYNVGSARFTESAVKRVLGGAVSLGGMFERFKPHPAFNISGRFFRAWMVLWYRSMIWVADGTGCFQSSEKLESEYERFGLKLFSPAQHEVFKELAEKIKRMSS